MTPRLLWGPRAWQGAAPELQAMVLAEAARRGSARVGESCAAWGPEPFDSEHFGMKMGRVHSGFGADEESAELIAAVAARADAEGYEHLAARIPSEDPALVRRFQREGFFFVDAHCTLTLDRLPDWDEDDGISEANPRDLPAIQELSESIFSLSRYAWDPSLSAEGRRALMRAWLANDCGGRAEFVLVSRDEAGIPSGYIACLLDEAAEIASIDLIAVSPRAQGQGLGQRLIRESCRRLRGRAKRMTVETQGSNAGAHRLYFRSGFVLTSTDISLHRRPQGAIPA